MDGCEQQTGHSGGRQSAAADVDKRQKSSYGVYAASTKKTWMAAHIRQPVARDLIPNQWKEKYRFSHPMVLMLQARSHYAWLRR